MRFARNMLRPAVAGLAVAVMACSDQLVPTAPDSGLAARMGGFQGGAEPPGHDELDRTVPGFGGFFLDADGSPTVYLTRGSDRRPAERALGAYLGARGLSAGALRVREGRFAWRALQQWSETATPAALEVPGAVFVDSDESANRVRIGVEDVGAMAQVRAALSRAGVPDDAVIVEQADPIFQVYTLQNIVDRPVRAGVQIHFGNYVCSVGFNATDGSQKSFVTASHCTNRQGGVEGTAYYQPLQSTDGTVIGTEVEDPNYFKNRNGCPRGRVCRWSDAARAAYANGSNQALGKIAQTSGANTGSLEIVVGSSLSITSVDLGNGVMGETVNKVGRTTGWTAGQVSATCVNTGVSGTNIVQLCQTFVSSSGTIVRGGDSGSGTFQVTGGDTVKLVGILWGGNSPGTLFVYSPFKNIQQELGTLKVF